MSRRFTVVVALAALGLMPAFARRASAQEPAANVQMNLAPLVARALAAEPALPASAAVPPFTMASIEAPVHHVSRISPAMASLYATTAAMQMMDVRSSLTAFNNGATEGNPLMAGITRNKAAFVAFKAGVAASLIWSGHSMAKHNKVGAILMLAAVNSARAGPRSQPSAFTCRVAPRRIRRRC